MSERINKVHLIDNMEFMRGLPDQVFDLIFIDPPYFNVKGDFDFKLSFKEWQDLHEKLAIECRRLLKNNGSIILWGHALKIAYQQIIFDKYFNILNVCIWEKKDCRVKKNNPDNMRRFMPITERFLFYDKGEDKSGLNIIYSKPEMFDSIKKYMRCEKEKIKKDFGFVTEIQFNDFINKITETKSVVSRHYFADSQYMFPTKEIYTKLQNIKNNKYFLREYESLRREYESLRRPFNLSERCKYDVMRYGQQSNITSQVNHPTQKPPLLIYDIIKTTCRPGSYVFSPFAGSCPERIVCDYLGLDFVGCELDPDYWQAQEDRYQAHIENQDLFSAEEYQDIIYDQPSMLGMNCEDCKNECKDKRIPNECKQFVIRK